VHVGIGPGAGAPTSGWDLAGIAPWILIGILPKADPVITVTRDAFTLEW
jgi:hypothetical protein